MDEALIKYERETKAIAQLPTVLPAAPVTTVAPQEHAEPTLAVARPSVVAVTQPVTIIKILG